MLIPAAFSLLVVDGAALAFGLPAFGAFPLGAVLFFLTHGPNPRILRQDVFLIVVLRGFGVATGGELRFVFSGIM